MFVAGNWNTQQRVLFRLLTPDSLSDIAAQIYEKFLFLKNCCYICTI